MAWDETAAARLWRAEQACVLSELSLRVAVRAIGRLKLTTGPFETQRDVLMENYSKYDRCLKNGSFVELRKTARHWLCSRRGTVRKEDLERAFYKMVAGDKLHYEFRTEEITSLDDLWNPTTNVKLLANVGTQFEAVFGRLHERVIFITDNGHPGPRPA